MKALFDFIDRTRRSTCPTCRYSGPGMKTVLPNSAWAKVDFRLVPDQDPHQVFAQLQGFLDTIGCGDFQVTLPAAEHPGPPHPGVSHPAANIHAPNESIFVDDYIRTIKGIGLLMAE